jgi:thiosulfate reductase cytochrome b subunit
MKINKIIKSALVIALGVFAFALCLVFFVKSYYYGDYGDSFEIAFSNDYLVGMMVNIIIIVYGVISLINDLKVKENHPLTFIIASGLYATITSFYTLGYAFKCMNKNKEFAVYQNYLYVGIFFLIILGIVICQYLISSKKDN